MPADGDKGFHPFHGKVSQKLHGSLSPHSHSHSRSPSRPKSSGDEAYLSYFDVRLTHEDVETLKDDWLTDNVISFWQEYLEHEYISKLARIKVTLLRPTMAFMLMQVQDTEGIRSALPDMDKSTHIFLPINNSTDPEEAEGGTHWSLLLVSLRDNVAFHYDSMDPSNRDSARHAARQLGKFLQREDAINFVNIEDAPQQTNSSDCGVFVCLLMKHLLVTKLLSKHLGEQVDMSVDHKDVNATQGRREIRRIIDAEVDRGRRSSSHRSRSRSTSPPRVGPETGS